MLASSGWDIHSRLLAQIFYRLFGSAERKCYSASQVLRVAQQRPKIHCVIRSIRHKGLRGFFESGRTAGIQAPHAARLRLLLTALDTAGIIGDMDIPGFRLHALKGSMKGRWSISVNANWRLTFEFKDGDVNLLDYEDYH